MLRIIQIVVIGSICAGVFALLYGNSTPVTVSFFGTSIASGSLGSFLLLCFFGGVLVCALGSVLLGLRQAYQTRRMASRERRMREAWNTFAEAQLSALIGEPDEAISRYQEIARTVPEATAAFAPLSAYGTKDSAELLPDQGNALVDFLHGQIAERERSYVRATERYAAAHHQAAIPALLRFARDAAIKAELIEKARGFHKSLANSTNLSALDLEVEASLAARDLPTEPEQRPAKLRDLVRRYPNSSTLVEELAGLENGSGKSDQAALLLGRAARLNPTEQRIAAFERQLQRLPLDRALSVLEQSAKGAPAELFLPTRLALLIHHRAISQAAELWSSLASHTDVRIQRLGAALALLMDRKDAAVESLCAVSSTDSISALTADSGLTEKKVVGLAPQFSTP